ncbi:UbiB domain containing protein [Trema orientale]|uniref:UbiB domain containing protein n=1 Tax=Trema orientale TaxID=63057 RepID=A0A2P5EIC8_TREOI|nr:UbiB domain containing protein [Trema orientale]
MTMLSLPILDFKDFQDNFVNHFRPWQRSFQFWVFQLRVSLVKDVRKKEEMWERQHEFAAEKIYSMCADLGGFFLKVAQIIGKPDLAPAAWVRRLVTLCDQAPATPFGIVQHVHRARLKGDKNEIIVKVQHPGIQDLMMTDIHNLQAFALYVQKTDIMFDLYSVTKEMEKQDMITRELGIATLSKCENEQQELFRLAQRMFDTKLPPGVTMLQPFSEDSSLKKVAFQSFPEELFSVLRTVHLLRGLSVGLGLNYSCAEQWRPIAEEALYQAGRLKGDPSNLKKSNDKKIISLQ